MATKASVNAQNIKYIVLRNGIRVSDMEYPTKEEANDEFEHWRKIINRYPDGSKLEISEVKE
jgi:hypothetical protein